MQVAFKYASSLPASLLNFIFLFWSQHKLDIPKYRLEILILHKDNFNCSKNSDGNS